MSGSESGDERLNRGFNARLMAAEASLLSPFVSPLVSPFRHVLLGRGAHTLAALVAELGTAGTAGDKEGTPGDSEGTRGDGMGTRGDSMETAGDKEGTPGDSEGTRGDGMGTRGDSMETVALGDTRGQRADLGGGPGDGPAPSFASAAFIGCDRNWGQ
ncbi:translation initiation factor IF-2-like [Pyrgilauda ruficollis]|uniref:translation initiation factor IF-2-like n=1 Tax=Pyrgilauda ruficollis TaxID=221976 RepID=UPI001B877B90|nr:translation initiation factor IF-2-like [Pyrgilauda ruficollis]